MLDMLSFLLLRDAARSLWRNPRLTFPVGAVLVVALAANGAVFALFDSVLLRSLPYPQPDRLVVLWDIEPDSAAPSVVSWPNFRDWQRQSRTFESLAAFNIAEEQLTGGSEPEDLWGAAVTPEFFGVLSAQPQLGRLLGPDDGPGGDPNVIVLGHSLWMRRFGGSAAIIGRTVRLSGVAKRIVGVTRADFRHPDPLSAQQTDFWVPLTLQPWMESREAAVFRVLGRLKPGLGLPACQAEMSSIAHRLAREHPATNAHTGIRAVPLHRQLVGEVRPGLVMLMLAMSALQLVACANAGNQLLVYRLRREKDFHVRLALGARRGALAFQAMIESLLLAFTAGTLASFLAFWSFTFLTRYFPVHIAGIRGLSFGGPAILFLALAALASGLLMSVPQLLKVLLPRRAEASAVYGATTFSPRVRFLRGSLLVAEIAIALPLLSGAALLAASFRNLERVDPGFRKADLATFRLSLPASSYPHPPLVKAFYAVLLQSLAAVQGVQFVGAVSTLPFTDLNDREMAFAAPGVQLAEGSNTVHDQVVSPGYFRAMRIRLLRGRDFTAADVQGAHRVVVLNRSLAERLWPRADPLGRQVAYDLGPSAAHHWMTVVGVVGDVRQQGLAAGPTSVFYRPMAQDEISTFTLVVRSQRPFAGLAADLKARVRALDPSLALADLQPMGRLADSETARSAFLAVLLEAVAAVTLLVTALGLVGLVSYLASQRSREMAIRMALGASRRNVLVEFLRPALGLLVLGVVLGVGGALAARPLLASLLFGVAAGDPPTLIASSLALLWIGLLACYIPARLATRLDLRQALQEGAL
jgi:putative ABC transport system permease protein